MVKAVMDRILMIVIFAFLSWSMGIAFPCLYGELPTHNVCEAGRAIFFFGCLFGLRVAFEKD